MERNVLFGNKLLKKLKFTMRYFEYYFKKLSFIFKEGKTN